MKKNEVVIKCKCGSLQTAEISKDKCCGSCGECNKKEEWKEITIP